MYIINDNCVFCRVGCTKVCPMGAIYFDGDKNCIDQSKCIQCGACARACAVGAIVDPEAPAAPPPVPHELIERECDVLIIGAGGSGLIAAARAAALSGKKVIAIDKGKKPYGCGWYSGGVRPYASKWQKEAGLSDPTDDYVRAAMNTTVGVLNPKLVYTAYNSQNEFFDWYCEWGEPEKYYGMGQRPLPPGVPADPNAKPEFIMKEYKGPGSPMLQDVYAYCQKLGVEFMLETAAYEFVMENGSVAAVRAKDPGGELLIRCKACLVAAGNLVNNRQILEKCIPDYVDSFQRRSGHCLPLNTGDGVIMAEKAGIPIDYENICAGFIGEMSVPFDPNLLIQDYRAEVLKVNLEGKRFMNEHSIQEGATFALLKQPHCVAWHVMDSKILASEPVPSLPVLRDMNYGRMMFTALPNPDGSAKSSDALMTLGPIPPMFGGHDMEPAPEAMKRISELKGGHVVIADTLEELAEKMGVPAENFLASVERYNQLCEEGFDADFYKQSCFMLPIKEGPFYALHNFLATDGVFGGYFVDEHMRVLDGEGGEPIPGLYASGDNTSSRFINRGGQRVEIINDYTWALGSGFTAGSSMAEYVK